jgi:hypothetical protein
MYSEQGFDALMRAVFGHGCQSLIVVSNCMPGSPQSQADSEIWRIRSRALSSPSASASVTAIVVHSPSGLHGAHELVGHAHRVVRVLELDRVVGAAVALNAPS